MQSQYEMTSCLVKIVLKLDVDTNKFVALRQQKHLSSVDQWLSKNDSQDYFFWKKLNGRIAQQKIM